MKAQLDNIYIKQKKNRMKKVIRLTESELIGLVKKVINESGGDIPKDHPINNSFWKEMIMNVEGEGVETVKFVPNKSLVIDAFGNLYTITKTKTQYSKAVQGVPNKSTGLNKAVQGVPKK